MNKEIVMDRNRLLMAMVLGSLSPRITVDGWDVPRLIPNTVREIPKGKNYFNRSANKYEPHQGKQAIARRKRQIEAGIIQVTA